MQVLRAIAQKGSQFDADKAPIKIRCTDIFLNKKQNTADNYPYVKELRFAVTGVDKKTAKLLVCEKRLRFYGTNASPVPPANMQVWG